MHAQRRQQQRTRRGSGRKHGHGKSTVGRATGVSASQGVATKAAVAAAAAAAASAPPDSDGGGEDVRERTERLYQSFRRSSFPEVSEMTASQLFERLQARQLERLLTLQQQQLFNTTAKSVATTAASASTAAATEGQELQGSPLPIRTDHRSGGVTTSSKSNPSSGSAWQLHESGGTNSLVVVDIRTRGEQQVSMLPGAITQVHFETHLSDLLHLSHNQPCARKRTSCSSSAEARVDDEESARASTPTTAGEILPDVKRPIHRVTVVAYCTIGMRSGVYIKGLQERLAKMPGVLLTNSNVSTARSDHHNGSNKGKSSRSHRWTVSMDIHKDDTCGSEDVIDARGMEVEVQCYNLRGSILAWTQQGLPLVDPKGKPTTQVHVFARDWEMLGKGYRAVWFSPLGKMLEYLRLLVNTLLSAVSSWLRVTRRGR